MAVVLLWGFISFPLCLVGTVVGRNWNAAPNFPCRVKRIPSPVPERAWYYRPWAISMAGGLLPFGSIFIEMYFIFTSFWGYKVRLKGQGDGRGSTAMSRYLMYPHLNTFKLTHLDIPLYLLRCTTCTASCSWWL